MCADVTLRYKTAFKLNPSLPPQMTEQVTKGMADFMMPESVIQLKEGKGASSYGKLRSVTDFTKQRTTLIDPEKKRIATMSVEQLTDEVVKMMAEMPGQARDGMAAMKSTAESRVTGRTETILGIEAEEREVTISMEGPALPNMPPGPMFKMGIQFWTAKAGEVLRVPALREITGYNLWANATMNPAGAVEKMLKQMPGMGESIGKIMKEMEAAKMTMLRSNFRMWMPALAAMMKQMPRGQEPVGRQVRRGRAVPGDDAGDCRVVIGHDCGERLRDSRGVSGDSGGRDGPGDDAEDCRKIIRECCVFNAESRRARRKRGGRPRVGRGLAANHCRSCRRGVRKDGAGRREPLAVSAVEFQGGAGMQGLWHKNAVVYTIDVGCSRTVTATGSATFWGWRGSSITWRG